MDERLRPPRRRQSRYAASRSDARHATLGVAHDFRNMLQLASSAARLVRREMAARSDDELTAMLDDALDALARANLLARRLTGAESGDCEAEELLIQQIVPQLRTLLSRALGPDIRFESLVAEDLPPMRCDRLQLENVLMNLALNARQAMPNGGTLVIEALPCVDPAHPGCIALSVTDSGHGMAPDVAEKAFEPFFSTRLLDGGNGLGLPNVRAFARGLGGSACLSSKENEGTRVVLHLPAGRTAGRNGHKCPDRFE